jgi:hypothetical protein
MDGTFCRKLVLSDAMPLFFFDTIDRGNLVPDEDGQELPSIEAARKTAIIGAREMMADAVLQGRDIGYRQFCVRDAANEIAFTLLFREAIE